MRWVLRILGGALILIIALGAVIAWNTWTYKPMSTPEETELFALGADIGAATDLLSKAVTYQTDSTQHGTPDFDGFLAFLESSFPNVHATMTMEMMKQKTPLYRWAGSDESRAPILLAAHYDVVPISQPDRWEHPPYSGAVADGFVWGRGTLDNKGALIAMLVAAEKMIEDGFQPKRTVYFSFGGDEEVGGVGAYSVAQALNARGEQLDWALDEGSFVLERVVAGLDVPVASINLAEKGYLTVKLTARAEGGHSSMPPQETAVGMLAQAVARVQGSPVPGGLTGVSASFFDTLGRYFTLDRRVVFANRWLFGPMLEGILAQAPSTNAMLRTTTAPTMLTGSPKENVLATEATAMINFRLHPRDTKESVLAHIEEVIDDPRIEVAQQGKSSPASPVSSADAQGYLDIRSAIFASFGPIATVPGLTIAATDARHYAKAAKGAYRINPFKITGDDLARFHGTNERLSIENLERGINFYGVLLQKQ